MFTLIYGSSAIDQLPKEELINILNESRLNNLTINVTGMLLYHDSSFLQVLEGSEKDVSSLFYDKICTDPRHEKIMLYVKGEIDKRQFEDWTMGFVDTRELDNSNISGYSSFLSDPDHTSKLEDSSYAYAFLNVFRKNIC